MGFIVGHNRDRDSYQVPLAFAELGDLSLFVTDYYHKSGLASTPLLAHRQNSGIDPGKVRQSPAALLRQLPYEFKRRIGHASFPSMPVESLLGRTIAKHARRMPDADLFLYSGSALQAFRGPSTGRRYLFQYHPSPKFIEATLAGIDDLAGLRKWEDEAEVSNPAMEAHHYREVSLADYFVVASSFTKKGLLDLGVDAQKIAVVPYGCPPVNPAPVPPPLRNEFLFVGQGVKRKGLHLLIEAWRRANLQGMRLRVVASRIDPEIADFAKDQPSIEITPRVSRQELTDLMASADTFVMPSLVEGFGLVFGEALAQGCRLIGSTNTGMVDYRLDGRIGTTVPAGNLEALTQALRNAAASMDPERPYWHEAVAAARDRSWGSFRAGIVQSVSNLARPGSAAEGRYE